MGSEYAGFFRNMVVCVYIHMYMCQVHLSGPTINKHAFCDHHAIVSRFLDDARVKG